MWPKAMSFLSQLQKVTPGLESVDLTSGMRNSIVQEKVKHSYQMFAWLPGTFRIPSVMETWISTQMGAVDERCVVGAPSFELGERVQDGRGHLKGQ